LSIIDKPTLLAPSQELDKITSQVRLMSEVKVVRRWATRLNESPSQERDTLPPERRSLPRFQPRIVAIATSTGGPGLLAKILAKLPGDFPVPVLIVQHITPGFGVGLVDWLNQQTPLQVRMAQSGYYPKQGEVLVAPDDYHMTIDNMGAVAVNQEPPMHGVRPAADYLFESVAKYYGQRAVGVILTGMGRDGAEGLLAMHKMGAHTIAQDKETSVVFGMPAVAIELGAVDQVLPAEKVAQAIQLLCGYVV
jgi:two-component system chemotaxis response regulator CheB